MITNEKIFHYAEIASGAVTNRKLIDLNQYQIKPNGKELYRSLFRFDKGIMDYQNKMNSLKGFAGLMWAESLPIDFDSEDLEKAKDETIKFGLMLESIYEVDTRFIDFSFSGSKGFHLVLDGRLFQPEGFKPDKDLYSIFKNIVETLSEGFSCVDTQIYNRSRLFRFKNSLNAKSGLFKIPLKFEELNLPIEQIKELAKSQRYIETFPKSEITVNDNLKDLYLKASNQKTILKPEAKSNIFEPSPKGQRHNGAIQIISALRNKGLNNSLCKEILNLWNNSLAESLPDDEIDSILNSTKEWGKQEDIEIIGISRGLDFYNEFVKSLKTDRIKLGFDKLDKHLRALVPGEVMQIQGATGYGKSMLALNISKNFVESTDKAILYFSLEMPSISLIERLCQMKLKKSGFEIEKDFETGNSKLYYNQMNALKNLYFVEKTNLDLQAIERYIDFFRENISTINFIVVDYLGLLKHKGSNIYERMSELGRNLKNLAKEKKVFILSLVQINRKGTVRDSGSIEEAADYILSLEKESDLDNEFSFEKSKGNHSSAQENEYILCILKNRKQTPGKIEIYFDNKDLTFKEK